MTEDAPPDLVDRLPDWADGDRAAEWLEETLVAVGKLSSAADGGAYAQTGFQDLRLPEEPGLLSRFGEPRWRRFALAIFAADLACYETPDDRVGFDRLLYVVDGFSQGFRVWWRRGVEGDWLPVGYTGWYPISEGSFRRLEAGDPTLADRLIAPLRIAPPHPFVYLFNYSVDASSRRSALSHSLISGLAKDLAEAAPAGMAAITVSEDGIRVAERFGMERRSTLDTGGLTEWIYISRTAS